MTGLQVKNGLVSAIETDKGTMEADFFVIAQGHSAFETYRMLMKRGVGFHTKNFALGSRMEHPQELINRAQWGIKRLKGVKAAEYRLTSPGDGSHPVYSFCMCPGGVVVPATAYESTNIVNGMSRYLRDGRFANAACVAGVNLSKLLHREISAEEALDWLEELEQSFYQYTSGYRAPICSIKDFIRQKSTSSNKETSYPMGVVQAPLWELLPPEISLAMRKGLKDFSRKMYGFEEGNLLGLESKTSAPVQVDRDKSGLCSGFQNLYVAGEGSGYSGGIISSAADGIKAALDIVTN